MLRFKRYKGVIKSAELCNPIENVLLKIFLTNGKKKIIYSNKQGKFNFLLLRKFSKIEIIRNGFNTKIYTKYLPKLIRLLEDSLIGYQPMLSYKIGDTVELFVNSKTNFTATLYRHGLVKEKIMLIGKFKPCLQQVPDGYFVDKGLNWKCGIKYSIPKRARSGIYSVLLKNELGEVFAVPMVITAIKKNKEIVVLASNTTWQSYNIWGGRSRYRNFEYFPNQRFNTLGHKKFIHEVFTKLRRLYLFIKLGKDYKKWVYKKLTIQRPFTNCQLEDNDVYQKFTNHLAAGEWRLVAWLEKMAFEYDFISGQDLHFNEKALKNYKVIILSTHSEYWSDKMYKQLKYYHYNKGLWILNLGGNSIYREIEFYKDGSTRCKSLLFYKSNEDESQLTGVRFTIDDYGTAAPYKILDKNHWIFQGVNNKVFGKKSLNCFKEASFKYYNPGHPGVNNIQKGEGASGWETDKLTKTASTSFKIIAKGLNINGGADMVIKESDGNRGGTFSASSILFGASLLIDKDASKIVENLINHILKRNSSQSI